jgi:hypothetical protein
MVPWCRGCNNTDVHWYCACTPYEKTGEHDITYVVSKLREVLALKFRRLGTNLETVIFDMVMKFYRNCGDAKGYAHFKRHVHHSLPWRMRNPYCCPLDERHSRTRSLTGRGAYGPAQGRVKHGRNSNPNPNPNNPNPNNPNPNPNPNPNNPNPNNPNPNPNPNSNNPSPNHPAPSPTSIRSPSSSVSLYHVHTPDTGEYDGEDDGDNEGDEEDWIEDSDGDWTPHGRKHGQV